MRSNDLGRHPRRRPRRGRSPAGDSDRQQDRWLISYADLITLLFALFVVMYAASTVHEDKYRTISQVLGDAFGGEQQGTARDRPATQETTAEPITAPPAAAKHGVAIAPARPELRPLPTATPAAPAERVAQPATAELIERATDAPPVTEQALADAESAPAGDVPPADESGPAPAFDPVRPDALSRLLDGLQNNVSELVDAELISVRRSGTVIEVEIREQLLFDSGSAAIGERAIAPIAKIADLLRDQPYAIKVAGYTDNVPINTAIYPSNWELSAARAASVVHLLMNTGIQPERMSAVGYGEYRPVADNASEQGRSRNRRVVLVIGDEGENVELPAPNRQTAAALAQN